VDTSLALPLPLDIERPIRGEASDCVDVVTSGAVGVPSRESDTPGMGTPDRLLPPPRPKYDKTSRKLPGSDGTPRSPRNLLHPISADVFRRKTESKARQSTQLGLIVGSPSPVTHPTILNRLRFPSDSIPISHRASRIRQ